MKRIAAVAGSLLGVLFLFSPAAAANVSLVALEGEVFTYSTLASSQFVLWAMLFAVSILSLLLSVCVPRCEDITGLLAVAISAYCTLSVPYLQYVEFHVGYILVNDTVGSVVTPVVVDMSSWTIFWACVLLLMVALVNGMRIVFMIADRNAPRERRERRRRGDAGYQQQKGEDEEE